MKALSEATARRLRPLQLSDHDRISLSLDKEGENFHVDLYQHMPPSKCSNCRGSGDEPGCSGEKKCSKCGGTGERREKMSPSWPVMRTFVQRIPERKQLAMTRGTYSWNFAATDLTVAVINAVYGRDRIDFLDDETKLMYNYILANGGVQDENAETYACFKVRQSIQAQIKDWPVHMKYRTTAYIDPRLPRGDEFELSEEFPLAHYQQVALKNSMRKGTPGYGLFMEQGTGKTPIIIAQTCNEAKALAEQANELGEGQMLKVIIVAPKNVRLNWMNEFMKFATQPGKVTVLRGGPVKRAQQIIDAVKLEDDCKYSVVVCSYETLQLSWKFLRMIEWDLAVLDESHYIKSPRAKRTKGAMRLRDRSKKRMVLTGTPVTNTILDLYTQLEFIGKGMSGFQSWRAFKEFYGVYKVSKSGQRLLVDIQNLPFMQERLARLSFIVYKSEVLKDLPPMVYDVIEADMSPEQWDVYKQVATQLAAEVEGLGDEDNKSLTINNVLTKFLRLAQITAGHIKWDAVVDPDSGDVLRPAVVDRFDPCPKLETLIETIKAKRDVDPTLKTIVWSCWVQDIKTIQARLKLEGIDAVTYYGGTSEDDRKIAEERFNGDPACTVFIGNPAAGGTGLNLLGYDHRQISDIPGAYDTNCDEEVYYSQNWSPTARSQSEARCHRRGTRVQIRVRDLCVPGTIDEQIRARVTLKRKVALQIADIKEILNTVLTGITENE